MTKLHIKLFGQPTIHLNESRIDGNLSAKAQGLLFYLAAAEQPQDRQTLTTLLWPEASTFLSSKYMRNTLPQLRKYVGPYLNITRRNISLNPQTTYDCDVREFQKCINNLGITTAAESTEPFQAPTIAKHSKEKAVGLYTGDFLDGFKILKSPLFEQWILLTREHLRELHQNTLEELAQTYAQEKKHGAALNYVSRLLDLNPSRESAHRLKMQILSTQGNVAAALAQYEMCRKLLLEELEVAPSRETVALYEKIRSGSCLTNWFETEGPIDELQIVQPAKSLYHRVPTSQYSPPAPLTELVGRQSEIKFIREKLLSTTCRLVTITGLGGVGKTHLALATVKLVQSSFQQGVCFVNLNELFDEQTTQENAQILESHKANRAPSTEVEQMERVAALTAQALNLTLDGERPIGQQVVHYLRTAEMLLFFDGFDLVTQSANWVNQLLAETTIKLLITSRTRLKLNGEQCIPLKGLTVPDESNIDDIDIMDSKNGNAVTLFWNVVQFANPQITLHREFPTETATSLAINVPTFGAPNPTEHIDLAQGVTKRQAHRADLAHIIRICQIVDGLPLAIQMAAGWTPYFSYEEISRMLENELTVGQLERGEIVEHPETGQGDPLLVSPMQHTMGRHRSIETVFNTTWQLLTKQEQEALANLTIFNGSFTRRMAQIVCKLTLADIVKLHSKSLVQSTQSGVYTIHPIIRRYASNQYLHMTQREPELRYSLAESHATYFLGLVHKRQRDLIGGESRRAIGELQSHIADIEQAWYWAVNHQILGLVNQALHGLFFYCEVSSNYRLGLALFETAATRLNIYLSDVESDAKVSILAKSGEIRVAAQVSCGQAHFLRLLSEYDLSQQLLEIVLIASGEQVAPLAKAYAQAELALILLEQGRYVEARDRVNSGVEGIDECLGNASPIDRKTIDTHEYFYMVRSRYGMIGTLGSLAYALGEYEAAHAYYQTSLQQAQQHGDRYHTATVLGNLAAVAQVTKRIADSENYLHARLQIDQITGNLRQTAVSYQRLGQLAFIRQDYMSAAKWAAQSLEIMEQVGARTPLAHILLDLSKAKVRLGKNKEAKRHCLRSFDYIFESNEQPHLIMAMVYLAEVLIYEEEYTNAAILLNMVWQDIPPASALIKTITRLRKTIQKQVGLEPQSVLEQHSLNLNITEVLEWIKLEKPPILNQSPYANA